jgi:hypothetical protein
MLCLVERRQMGRLGADPSAPYVASRRSSQEKAPWKSLPEVANRVEAEFLRPVLLGESILPYRVFRTFEGVVPVDGKGKVLDADAAAARGYDGLRGWMRKAEAVWKANAESGAMTLVGRWNYHNELGSQFPIAALRVVYAKAGTLPAASLLRDPRAVIDHKLYWMITAAEVEGRYLAAILNSETAGTRGAVPVARPMGRARFRQGDVQPADSPLRRSEQAASRARRRGGRSRNGRRCGGDSRGHQISTGARDGPRRP